VCDSRRILIVDDEDAIRFAMRDYFTVRGYQVDAARDVAEARVCLDRSVYAAVIADLCLTEMPSAEGLDVAAHARRSAPGTPVILFTAYGSPEVEAEARRHGVLAVLRKPQPLMEVERLIRTLASSCKDRPGSAAS
jgi:DNA-binding NtrC family response regulator